MEPVGLTQPPRTRQDALCSCSDDQRCPDALVALRWPDGVRCPPGGSAPVHSLAPQRRWQCQPKPARRPVSLKGGPVMAASPPPLAPWLPALWLLAHGNHGLSSYALHRALGVPQQTAWFLRHRIRSAMQQELSAPLGGRSKPMQLLLAARLTACTSRSRPARSRAQVGPARRPVWGGESAARGRGRAGFMRWGCRTPSEPRCLRPCASPSPQAVNSTPMRRAATGAWPRTPCTKSSTLPRRLSGVTSPRTALSTAGPGSHAPSQARMSVWSRSLCAGLSMSRAFASMRGTAGTRSALWVASALVDKRLPSQPLSGEGNLAALAAGLNGARSAGPGRQGCAPSGGGAGGVSSRFTRGSKRWIATGPSIYSLAGGGRRFMEREPTTRRVD